MDFELSNGAPRVMEPAATEATCEALKAEAVHLRTKGDKLGELVIRVPGRSGVGRGEPSFGLCARRHGHSRFSWRGAFKGRVQGLTVPPRHAASRPLLRHGAARIIP